ncbi:MAG: hypothetical protein C5B52_11980 [Bacteroidetes bacterium]|nr:MAG: hypothetical protein C5B52_11980 [Bacteroidota bacterium]
MKNKLLFTSIFCLFIMAGFAGDINYDVAKIAIDIRKSANAVKRMEEVRFELVDIGKARYYHKYAITVLNENGDKYVRFGEYYDKLHSIESIDGTLYDANGKKVRSLKNQK